MIGLLIVTHGELGEHFVTAARGMLGALSRPTETLTIANEDDPTERRTAGHAAIARLDSGHGVLILTDVVGATPSNVARAIAESSRSRLVAGVNLAMLIRAYNYPDLGMDDLVVSTLDAGQKAVVDWSPSVS